MRFDVSRLDAVKRDGNGYLIADAAVTRTGVFVYRQPDGTVTRELRHPDEVFNKDSLETLRHRPITFGHPSSGKLTSKNTKHLSIGTAIGDVKHDEKFVNTTLQIVDEDAITKATADENPVRQVSCGYEAEVVEKEGEYNGERYDHVQTKIRYNHIALVPRGRAGHEVELKLDAGDAVMTEDEAEETDKAITVRVSKSESENDSTTSRVVPEVEGVTAMYYAENESSNVKEFVFSKSAGWTLEKAKEWAHTHRNDSIESHDRSKTMTTKSKIRLPAIATATFKIDGVQVEFDGTVESSEKAFDMMNARFDAAIEKIKELEGKNQGLQGKLDQMGENGKISASKVSELAKQRADVCGVAAHVGLKNFDNIETDQIKRMVVMKCSPQHLDVDQLTDEYVQGRFDGIVQEIKNSNRGLTSLANLKHIATDAKRYGLDNRADEVSPREKLLAETADLWKGNTAAA